MAAAQLIATFPSAPIAPPLAASGSGQTPPSIGMTATDGVPPSLGATGHARVPRPIGASGVSSPPFAAEAPALIAAPIGANGSGAIPAPIGADGSGVIRPLVRTYNIGLAFLALIGTLGQWTSQNDGNHLSGHIEENIAVAWRELQLAWRHGNRSVPFFPGQDELAHIDRFARLVIELTNLERMAGIHVPRNPDGTVNEHDGDPPLTDRLLRFYFIRRYRFAPVFPPQEGEPPRPYLNYA